jgi:chromosome segregation ATPase
MRVAWLVVTSALLVGCATGPLANGLFATRSAQMLARADKLAADGDYRSAIAAYDAYLADYADSSNAPRARASRDVLTTREEMGRLQQELARMRDELAKREGDLARVRQEAERLRADLERLKQIDLQLEKRR